MRASGSYRYLVVAACGLWTLALLASTARAEVTRTGSEPWYQQPNTDIGRAQELFAQAVSKHLQLLRGDARDLYSQALALWDNPDIRWNLALVLEDLGQYLRAHRELERAARWGETLGAERLQDVRDRMAVLETKHLARIEAFCDEPAVEILLDGQPWFNGGSRHQSMLVDPGAHYVVARKAGFFPVSRSISVIVGQVARLDLPMDADRMIEARRWPTWKPWVVASAGLAVVATGAVFRHESTVNRELSRDLLIDEHSVGMSQGLAADIAGLDGRVVVENRIALGAFIAGGTTTLVGLALIWVNQGFLQSHRSEARPLSPIEISPLLSTNQVGISVGRQF